MPTAALRFLAAGGFITYLNSAGRLEVTLLQIAALRGCLICECIGFTNSLAALLASHMTELVGPLCILNPFGRGP